MGHRFVTVAAIALAATSARAQTDQLECFKVVKDVQRKALVTTLLQGVTPPHGCTIRLPAKLMCLPTVRPAVSTSQSASTAAGANVNAFLCYQVRCRRGAVPPPQVVGDMFGKRRVKAGRSRLFCTPVPTNGTGNDVPTTTTTLPPDGCNCTTTTTTTTTVTTTTIIGPHPSCVQPNTACGSCGNGACQPTRPEGFFVCTFQTQGLCKGSCQSSADCGDGDFCVGASGESGQCCAPCF